MDYTPFATTTAYFPFQFADGNRNTNSIIISDINADGADDLLYAEKLNQTGSPFVANTELNNANPFTDMLAQVKSSEGSTTTISYKMSTKYFDSNNNLLNPKLPIAVKTVSMIVTNDGFNNYNHTSYTYADGSYYYNNPTDRKFAGFGLVTETDPEGNVTKTYFHQGNTSSTTIGEYDDHISKAGKAYRIERYDAYGNLYSKIINKWDKVDLGSGASFVKLTDSVEYAHDAIGGSREKAVSFEYDNSDGNLTRKVEYGEVTGTNSGSYTDTGTDKYITQYSYSTSTISGIPSRYALSKETVVDNGSTKVNEKKTYYDNQSFGGLTSGNPTKTEFWKSGSTYVDTEKVYNSYGLVTQDKDPRDKTTTYEYENNNLYVATTTNPKSQRLVYQYDYSSGKIKQAIDANGFKYQTIYDGFDRPIEEKQPDITTPSTLVAKTTYSYVDTGALPYSIHKINYLNSATSTDMYTYLDGYGRVIQERTEAEDAGQFSVRDIQYNGIGKVSRETLPYFSNGSSKTAAATTTSLFVNYVYDPLARVVQIGNALGTTHNSYDDWKVTITDPDNKLRVLYKDAYDNLIRVVEFADNMYTTSYEYDGNKKLTKITDALGNVRNFTNDGLGRRITAQDLHASTDTTFGTWYYEYDDAGNLASTTDPKSQNVVYTYDDLNRPLTENYTGASGTEVQYGYDTCQNGVGKLCAATTSAVISRNQYNALGGISREQKLFSNGLTNYSTYVTYDRQGNVLTMVHPDTSTTTNVYNTAGQLEKIYWQGDEDLSPTLIIEDIDYNPTGKTSYIKSGNGVETTNTYDPSKLYRLTAKLSTKAASSSSYTTRFYAQGGDGVVWNSGISTSWSDMHNAAVGADADYTNNELPIGSVLEGPNFSGFYLISRAFYPFNTGSIPANAIITNATFNVYASSTYFSNTDNDGNDFLVVVQTSQASPSSLSVNDYSSIGTSEGSNRVDFGGLTLNSYNTFTLNPQGVGWVKKAGQTSNCGAISGWTCIGTREGHDIQNVSISDNTENTVTGPSSENAGTSKDPYLEVAYQIPAVLQDLVYTYSPAGDILSIEERASTSAYRKVEYQYDDLHRLTRASSTRAANNYLETYSYNGIGNLTNKSDLGGYVYGGNTGTLFANPHAPTSINGNSLTYDNNGNLLTYGSQSNTWDYENRLLNSINGSAVSTSTYDHMGERASYTDSAGTIRYIDQFYATKVTGDYPTRYIYANDDLVATIEDEPGLMVDFQQDSMSTPELLDGGMEANSDGGCCVYQPPYVPVVHYIHDDQLNGSNVVTDTSGDLEEVIDYHPFGKIRFDESITGFKEKHKFIGEFYDESSELSYLNARYMDGERGQFLSQDPVFWEVGQTSDGKIVLAYPQAQNSYSYAVNSPIVKSDPNGRCPICYMAAIGGLIGMAATYAGDVMQNRLDHKTGTDVLMPNSSFSQYAVNAAGGAAGAAVLTSSPIIALGIPFTFSALEDFVGGGNINLTKASIAAILSVLGVRFVNSTAGVSVLETALSNGRTISGDAMGQGLRHLTVKEVLTGASNILVQSQMRLQGGGATQLSSSARSSMARTLRNISRILNRIRRIISRH